jgi:hypothetical protein
VALGVNFEGQKEVLGLWIAENEGAKFWMGVLNELRCREVEDILICDRRILKLQTTPHPKIPKKYSSWVGVYPTDTALSGISKEPWFRVG